MKRNCLNVVVKYLIGFSLALIAVSNCFNVLSSSSFLVASPSSDASRAEAAKLDSPKLNAPSSVSDKLDGGSSLFNSPLNSPNKRSTSALAGARPASLTSPFTTTLTATKTDNVSTPVNPGDTIMYTIEITNTGAEDATSVQLMDTLDANVTLVAGTVKVAPIAVNDSYNTIGNVNISVPVGQGVIANDLNPNGSGTLAVTLVNATPVPGTASTTNGSVTMASDGSFTYTPNAGFSGPTDTFTYTLGNSATPGKTDTATVTITISGLIWFVDNTAGPAGDGRLNTPFRNLVGGANPLTGTVANDVIFIHAGSGNYTGGLTLTSGEKVIGKGASQSIETITGFSTPSGNIVLPTTSGTDPVIITGVGATAITLGSANGLHGFTIGNTTTSGTKISGTSFGTLTVKDLTLNGAGRALNLATGNFASGSAFDGIESLSSTTEGLKLSAVGGSFTIPTTSVVNSTGTAIDVQSSPAGTNFSFGTTSIDKGLTSGTGVNLNSNSGTFAFSSLGVITSSGTGVSATSSGTVNVTTGSIAATGGPALLVNPTAIGMTFTTVSSTTSTTTGISLTSASGTLTIGTTTITNPTGIGISVSTSSATLNFGNTTSTQSGGTGVALTTNTGGIAFTSLDVTPDSGQKGLLATENSGTITVNSAATLTGGTIDTGASGAATAVEITRSSGTTPLNITLRKVNSQGGTTPGILLSRTSGSFTVTGDGGASNNGTGGTISGKTGSSETSGTPGVRLKDGVSNVRFRYMNITGNNHSGIYGGTVANPSGAIDSSTINGFQLDRCTITGNGDTGGSNPDETGVDLYNLVGTASGGSNPTSITNTTISNNFEFELQITNATSTALTDLQMSGNTISSNGATGAHGNLVNFLGAGGGSANMKLSITSGTFTGAAPNTATGVQVDHSGSGGTVTGNISGCTFTNNNAAVSVSQAQGGNLKFNVNNNSATGNRSHGLNLFVAAIGTGTCDGSFTNNIVGTLGTAGSGSDIGFGIRVQNEGSTSGAPAVNVFISGNTVQETTSFASVNVNQGIALQAATRTTNVTITNNVLRKSGSRAIIVQQNNTTAPGSTCADISGNEMNNIAGNVGDGTKIRLRQLAGGTFNLKQTSVADLAAANSPPNGVAATTTTTGEISTSGTITFNAGTCTQPMLMSVGGEMATSSIGSKDDATSDLRTDIDDILRTAEWEVLGDRRATSLSPEELAGIGQAALERWRQTGISAEAMDRLQAVTFELADLPEHQLAAVTSNIIRIDENAAGFGWYFDQFPNEDSEFELPVIERQLEAVESSHAYGKVDLLTVVMRELGYVYLQGKDRIPKRLQPLMQDTLPTATRRLPMLKNSDRLTSPVGVSGVGQPHTNSVLQAQSSATTQPEAPQASSQAVTRQLESIAAKRPADVRYAVFNPSGDLMPGNYSRSAKRMNYTPSPRRIAAARPMFADMVNLGPFTIPPGEKIVIMFNATVNAANTLPPGTSQVCNQGFVSATGIASFGTDDPDAPPGPPTPNATCTQLNVADVSVTKSAGASPICSTSNITYTINYNNAGPAAAVNALVSDAMPVGTLLVSVTTPATWTRTDSVPNGGNGTITFTKASSPNGEMAVFTIVVSIDGSVADGTVIQNTATVTSDTPDQNTANNTSAPTSTTVKKPPTTATVGGAQTICALGTTAALGGNPPTIGTGTWTVQSGGTGTFNPSAATPGATFTHTSGTGPIVLRWTISNPPCPDSFAEVTITVNAQPTATVGGPQTICALGTTASLGGNTPTPPATGQWSVVTGGVTGTFTPSATTPGATFTHTSGGIGSTITVRWTVSNPPCTAATADELITIKSQPTATVGGPQTICAGGTTAGLGGNTPASGETGTWSIVTAGVVGTFNSTVNTPNATFTHTSGGSPSFILRWTVSNPPCTPATADVTISLLPAPVATAGGPQTICELGTTASLGGNTPAMGETGQWSIVTAGVTGTFTPDANTPGATFTHTSGGVASTITLRWTVTNPTCGGSATADVLITVKQQPTATVGGAQTICALGTTAGLGGNTPAGGATGTWTIVTGGATGTFTPNANAPNATFTHTGGTGTITLRWTVSNPPCSDATADVVITITQPPTTAAAGGAQTICALGTTASLGGNTPTIGTGLWTVQSGGTGTFNPSASTPGATFTHLTGTGPIVLRWTISNPPCPDSFAEVIITITQPPTAATTGGNQTICALGTTASLGGNTPTSGTGLWTVQSGGTGTFNPSASTPGATFTHTSGTGPIVLRWTISNPPCPDSFAELTITITQSPTAATVGGNQTICALGTTAGLGGNNSTSGGGTWTVQSGGAGTFSPDANTGNATFTHTSGIGPIVLRWTISNAPCPDSFAEVTITITQQPTPASVGGPQTICEGSTTTGLGGNTPSSGTGTWTIVTGGATGTFNPNATTPNATFTPTSGAGTITVRWTISNPPCPDSFAEVIITVKQQPTATAGSNQTICAAGTTAGLGGNTPAGGATGMWSIVTGGATGTFSPNASTPNATFTHTGGTGTITVRWTVSNPPCANATADVVITITQPPTTAMVGPNQTIVPGGTTAGLGGNTPTSGTGMWSIVTPGATGTFNPNASTPNATWTHTAGSGLITLRWTISNAPCPSSQADVTIQIGVAPTINCPASPIVVDAAPDQCSASVSFTVTATGIPASTVTCIRTDTNTVVTSPATFNVGMTTINCTATNGIPPDAMCSFTVQVNDTQPPMITCPANITAKTPQAGNPCVVVNYATPVATDNCPAPTVVCTPPSGSCFPVGTTTVTCTATDASGNTATCTFKVAVFDLCLQDDSNPTTAVLINTFTGDYRFCCNGVTYTGKGTITIRGSTYTLVHNPSDRRVLVKADESVHKGSGSIQSPPGTIKCTITDRNTQNNSCACQ